MPLERTEQWFYHSTASRIMKSSKNQGHYLIMGCKLCSLLQSKYAQRSTELNLQTIAFFCHCGPRYVNWCCAVLPAHITLKCTIYLQRTFRLSGNSVPMLLSLSNQSTEHSWSELWSEFLTRPLRPSYLHDSVPVVSRGHLEECEEGHPKVLKGSMTAHALAGVLIIAYCKNGDHSY